MDKGPTTSLSRAARERFFDPDKPPELTHGRTIEDSQNSDLCVARLPAHDRVGIGVQKLTSIGVIERANQFLPECFNFEWGLARCNDVTAPPIMVRNLARGVVSARRFGSWRERTSGLENSFNGK
jgi:hypothetical protein